MERRADIGVFRPSFAYAVQVREAFASRPRDIVSATGPF